MSAPWFSAQIGRRVLCYIGFPLAETRKQLLLKNAAKLIGQDELAIRMKVPGPLLEAWINGHATMPDRKLIALAEVLDKLAAPH